MGMVKVCDRCGKQLKDNDKTAPLDAAFGGRTVHFDEVGPCCAGSIGTLLDRLEKSVSNGTKKPRKPRAKKAAPPPMNQILATEESTLKQTEAPAPNGFFTGED